MIQPVMANINFNGRVNIGYNEAQRVRIAEYIDEMPGEIQPAVVNNLVELKKTLAKQTPDDANLFINLEYDKFTKYRKSEDKAIYIEVKDAMQLSKKHPLGFSFVRVSDNSDDIPQKELEHSIDRAFDKTRQDTLENVKAEKYSPDYKNSLNATKIFDMLA